MRLRTRLALATSIAFSMALAPLASADPPAHAPAHGYRAKAKGKAYVPAKESAGVEVVFDSERGIHVAVGLPGVLFHDGHYYREHEGRWQVSLSGSGGWSLAASGTIPEVDVTSKKRHPVPANAR